MKFFLHQKKIITSGFAVNILREMRPKLEKQKTVGFLGILACCHRTTL